MPFTGSFLGKNLQVLGFKKQIWISVNMQEKTGRKEKIPATNKLIEIVLPQLRDLLEEYLWDV